MSTGSMQGERAVDAPSSYTLVKLALWSIAIAYLLCIDLKPIWTDEGNRYILMSGGRTWQQYNQIGFGTFTEVLESVGGSPYQPLFYLVNNAVVRLAHSHSYLLLRLVNIIWFILACHGLLRFFRHFSTASRLFALCIFGLNGFMLMNVLQIREYPLYLALVCWTSVFNMELMELSPEAPWRIWWPRLAVYGGLAALCFYSQPNSVFALAAQGLIFLTRKPDRIRFLRRIALSYTIAAAMILPWLVFTHLRFPNRLNFGNYDTRQPTLAILIATLQDGFIWLLTYNAWTRSPLLPSVVVILLVGIPASWVAARWSGETVDRRNLLGILTFVIFGAFQCAFFFIKEIFATWPRYFVGYYFGYAVMATGAFAILERCCQRRPMWKVAPAGVFVVFLLAGLRQLQLYREYPYMDTGMSDQCNWRVVSHAMVRHVRPEDTIAYYYPLQAWTMGVTNGNYPRELSYQNIIDAKQLDLSGLWMFDTSVTPDYTEKTRSSLNSLGYLNTQAIDLGCQCRLLRYQRN